MGLCEIEAQLMEVKGQLAENGKESFYFKESVRQLNEMVNLYTEGVV